MIRTNTVNSPQDDSQQPAGPTSSAPPPHPPCPRSRRRCCSVTWAHGAGGAFPHSKTVKMTASSHRALPQVPEVLQAAVSSWADAQFSLWKAALEVLWPELPCCSLGLSVGSVQPGRAWDTGPVSRSPQLTTVLPPLPSGCHENATISWVLIIKKVENLYPFPQSQ